MSPLPIGRIVAGAGVLSATALLTRRGDLHRTETRAFRFLNRDIGRAERPLWMVMQGGNALVALVSPLALRLGGRPWNEAARAGVAAAGGWQLAKGVKALVPRERPTHLLDDVVLRDGDPDGKGFVSGHATVAMSTALALSPTVGTSAATVLVLAALTVGLARIHVGAHLPLDVVGAIGLATIWGTACAHAAGDHQ